MAVRLELARVGEIGGAVMIVGGWVDSQVRLLVVEYRVDGIAIGRVLAGALVIVPLAGALFGALLCTGSALGVSVVAGLVGRAPGASARILCIGIHT